MKIKLLFVCLGNICRSPAADGIMRKMVASRGVEQRVEIDSAGTYGGHVGELPDPRMRAAASKRGYKLDHRARQFKSADFERFDMILVMDDSNYDDVCRLAPDMESLGKVRRMTDYCRKYSIDHVPDPYYEGVEGFEYVLEILEDACGALLDEVLDAN